MLLFCVSGRLAKTASQTGEVLLNGHRKTNLSYGIAVWTLILSLSLSGESIFFGILLKNWTLSQNTSCSHLLWHSAQKLDSLSYLSPSENTSVSHLVWLFAQKLGFLSQRTQLHIILAILHRNWALSLREHIFFTSSLAILHRIQITNTVKFHILSIHTASETLQVQ